MGQPVTVAEHDLVSVKDAAKIAGYSKQTIYNWLNRGILPGRQLYQGSRWLISREDLLKLLREGVNAEG